MDGLALSRITASPFAVAMALAFVAGFADTLGFILLGGLFVAHVTGNFILIGAALPTSSVGVLVKIAMCRATIRMRLQRQSG